MSELIFGLSPSWILTPLLKLWRLNAFNRCIEENLCLILRRVLEILINADLTRLFYFCLRFVCETSAQVSVGNFKIRRTALPSLPAAPFGNKTKLFWLWCQFCCPIYFYKYFTLANLCKAIWIIIHIFPLFADCEEVDILLGIYEGDMTYLMECSKQLKV